MIHNWFKYIKTCLSIGLLSVLVWSCQDNSFYEGSDVRLGFSTDTVSFDTIFTTIGSTTLNFRVYNAFDQPINIDHVALANGDHSNFRLNVDGYQGKSMDNVKVFGRDSIYVFVEVTIDPNDQTLPLLVRDSIEFTINNTKQYINLEAYGLNAHHYIAHADSDYLALSNTVFKAGEAYLIHDHLLVKKDATLRIEPGAKVYFRKHKSLYVQGTLRSYGTLDEPVEFSGDRWDDLYNGYSYDKVPGQWGSVHLLAGSHHNIMNYTYIRNATVGVRVDSVVTQDAPTLKMTNSKIINCNSIGLYALGAHVEAENCVFANCGELVVGLLIGGTYNFTHCTIGNYYDWGSSSNPAMYINNFYQDLYGRVIARDLIKADFKNCIIYGRNSDELMVENEVDGEAVNAKFNYVFDHCIIRNKEAIDTIADTLFTNILWNKDPKFVDPSSSETGNFELDTLSAAKDQGLPEYAQPIPFDLLGVDRLADGAPDLGAYEKVYETEEVPN